MTWAHYVSGQPNYSRARIQVRLISVLITRFLDQPQITRSEKSSSQIQLHQVFSDQIQRNINPNLLILIYRICSLNHEFELFANMIVKSIRLSRLLDWFLVQSLKLCCKFYWFRFISSVL